MKIRRGFVSNSSSSSFVIVGKRFKSDNKNSVEIAEKLVGRKLKEDEEWDIWDKYSGENYLSDDGYFYLGKVLADVRNEEGYMEISEFDINKSIEDAYEFLKKLDIKKEDIKLICGTRSC